MYSVISLLGLLLLTTAPLLILRRAFQARWMWFGLGIASWAAAVAAKHLLAALFKPLGFGDLPAVTQGAVWGILSATLELGATALLFRKRSLKPGDVLATGVGIGAFEVVYVIGTVIAASAAAAPALAEAAPGGEASPLVQLSFLLQRCLAMVGHVASRVLVYLAVHRRILAPALIAVAAFALIDGVAYGGLMAKWDWTAPAVLASYYLFIAFVGAVESAAAWLFWRRPEPGEPSLASVTP